MASWRHAFGRSNKPLKRCQHNDFYIDRNIRLATVGRQRYGRQHIKFVCPVGDWRWLSTGAFEKGKEEKEQDRR